MLNVTTLNLFYAEFLALPGVMLIQNAEKKIRTRLVVTSLLILRLNKYCSMTYTLSRVVELKYVLMFSIKLQK